MIERKKEHPVSALDTPLRSFVVVRCSSQALSRRKEKDEVVRGRGGDTRYSRSRRRCWCRCAQIYRFPESWRRGCRRQSNWFFCPLLPRRSEFLAWREAFRSARLPGILCNPSGTILLVAKEIQPTGCRFLPDEISNVTEMDRYLWNAFYLYQTKNLCCR